VSGSEWVEWGKGYIDVALREANQPKPVGYAVVHNAWQGAEDCLKAVLIDAGVPFQRRTDHNLQYYVNLIDSSGLANKAQVGILTTSVATVCMSGSGTDFRYPETDPQFFANLGKADIQGRANNANKVYDVCHSIVSGP
jgi:hypothetical protein